jgi:hypothetical protein
MFLKTVNNKQLKNHLSNHQPTLVLLINQVTDIPATNTEEMIMRIIARFFFLRRLLDPELS